MCTDAEAAQLLLQFGAYVETLDDRHKTALHYAATREHPFVIRAFFNAGPNKEACDNVGFTVLHCGAWHGQRGIVEELLNAGADLTLREQSGKTPVDIAEGKNDQAIVELLEREDSGLQAAGAKCPGAQRNKNIIGAIEGHGGSLNPRKAERRASGD